jgi:hypothetical protein
MFDVVLFPKSLFEGPIANLELASPISFSRLGPALEKESDRWPMFEADIKAWENRHRDYWRAQGHTILVDDDSSIWWPEGMAASYGLSNRQLTRLVFLATEHRKCRTNTVHYLGALEWIYMHSLIFFDAMPVTRSNTPVAKALSADLGIYKADFDVYSLRTHYAKTVGHLVDFMDHDLEQTGAELRLFTELKSKLIEEADKGSEFNMHTKSARKFVKKVDQSEKLVDLLGVLANQANSYTLAEPLTKKWADYVGLKWSDVKTGQSLHTLYNFAQVALSEYSESVAIKHYLYILAERGGLYANKDMYYVGDKVFSYSGFETIIPTLEKFAFGGQLSTSKIFSHVRPEAKLSYNYEEFEASLDLDIYEDQLVLAKYKALYG